MTATRQDAWTPDDDLLLAEVSLRYIRDGGTQLAAFEEVGMRLGRTAAACGFRWNSAIRKNYESAIQLAKTQRQERKRAKRKVREDVHVEYQENTSSMESEGSTAVPAVASRSNEMEEELSFEVVIRFLRNQKDAMKRMKHADKELEARTREVEQLRAENEELKKELSLAKADHQVVNDDYRALIQIMDRARKLAILGDAEEVDMKPRFKMDANGNLERVNHGKL
ncbi:RsfA family transcriptional regulator [Aneurinibacillus tyrosinisolvens]|uniref:RsfA family transcriptional regulator n=1 Tax=Aneurinibacillus tyrosinisolvens TaxID=1443435 RepID=UPI00063F021C|nr:RsfA family transcriptional regulator [Aneurinibacillus tyrosinisolvens]